MCALKSALKTNGIIQATDHTSATYVKVSPSLFYKPLPKISPLVYIASPIVKFASAIVATEPKPLKEDLQYMVTKSIYSKYISTIRNYINY
jgi:hypothetical protein